MIRLVHISDLHLGSDPATYRAPAISGLANAEIDSLFMLAAAASLPAAGDLPVPADRTDCIFSGDFSANGEMCQLRDAVNYLQRELAFTAATPPVGLRYGDQTHCTLGNHDIWGGSGFLAPWLMPGRRHAAAEHFLGHPSPWAWRISSGAVLQQTFLDAGALRIRAYLLDSTLPGLMNAFAHGRVDQRQIDDLKRMVQMDEIADKGRRVLRIAVLHHPVGWRRGITMILEQADHLRDELEGMEFGMVLCGHVHTCDVRPLNGAETMWQFVSGSATQTTLGRDWNEFQTYDIDTADSGSACAVHVRRYIRPGTQHARFQLGPTQDVNVRVVT